MDERQFSEMVGQYERLIYSICYQMTRDYHTAEDLTQDTFLSAYSHLASCPQDNPKAWLARIATNKAKDFLKSAYHRRVMATDEGEVPDDKQVLFIREEQPEDITISRDEATAIEAQIRALKEPYHQVAVLFFLEERTVEEISGRLGRPAKTVHTQLWRAKKMLQQQIERGGDDGAVQT